MIGVVGADAAGQRLAPSLRGPGRRGRAGRVRLTARRRSRPASWRPTPRPTRSRWPASTTCRRRRCRPRSSGALIQQIETLVPVSRRRAGLELSRRGGHAGRRSGPSPRPPPATPSRPAWTPRAICSSFRGFTLVKSNQPDAEAALGHPLGRDDDFAAGRHATGRATSARDHVVITRGADGMSRDRRRRPAHPSAADQPHRGLGRDRRRRHGDRGAGARAGGQDRSRSRPPQLANAAAGLVVRRIGVATVSPAELLAALGRNGDGADGAPDLPRAPSGAASRPREG